jgi:hypothetical protein
MQEFIKETKPMDAEKEATKLAHILDRDQPDDMVYDKPIKELSATLMQAGQKEFNEILEKTTAKDVKLQGADLDLGTWNEKTKSWDWNENRTEKGFDRALYSASPEGMFWRIAGEGDTLSKIIQEEYKYSGFMPVSRSQFNKDFLRINKISEPDKIRRGQALQIPSYEG